MRRSSRASQGFWLLGGLLFLPRPVEAQVPAAGAADLVGTWEDAGWGDKGRLGNRVPEFLTIRPDGLWLETTIDTAGGHGDTVACTRQISDRPGVSESARRGWYRLKGQELHENSGWAEDRIYKRIEDPTKGPLGRLIATGYGVGRLVPAHTTSSTGTLADWVGAWQADSSHSIEGGASPLPSVVIIHEDSVVIEARRQIVRGDTLACGRLLSLGGWARHGDSLYFPARGDQQQGQLGFHIDGSERSTTISLLLLRAGRLNYYNEFPWKDRKPYESYRPIDIPKHP